MAAHSSPASPSPATEEAHLVALGYSGHDFHRSMSLWANLALGFTYLSPLVGVYSLFAYSLTLGGPPAIWWIVIVGSGQFTGGAGLRRGRLPVPACRRDLPLVRRLWGRRYAWMVSWVYLWAVIVTVTAVAEFGGGFVAALFGIEANQAGRAGHRCRAAPARHAVQLQRHPHARAGGPDRTRRASSSASSRLGLFLLIFQRENSFSVFFDPMGAGGRRPTSSPSSRRPLAGSSCSTGSRPAAAWRKRWTTPRAGSPGR